MHGLLRESCIRQAENELRGIRRGADKVRKIRNKIVAHMDSETSPQEILTDTRLTLGEIEDLISRGLGILDGISRELNGRMYAPAFASVDQHTKALLDTLTECIRT
jgi:hypothetical protein